MTVRALQLPVAPALFSVALGDQCDPSVFLDFRGALVMLSLFGECGEELGRISGSRS